MQSVNGMNYHYSSNLQNKIPVNYNVATIIMITFLELLAYEVYAIIKWLLIFQ